MPDGNTLPPRDHNNPPPYSPDKVDAHSAKVAEFLDAAGAWLEIGNLSSEDQASELNDFIAGLRKRYKLADEDRKSDKKPHDEAAKAVQSAYAPILDRLKAAADRVQPLMTEWLSRKKREQEAEAARQREEARKKAEEAERLAAQAASRHDVAGEVAADEARKEAERAAKEAERAAKARANTASATGGGRTASLREYRRVQITNINAALIYYAQRPEVADCIKRLAEAEARAKGFDPAKDRIPGCEIIIEERSV